MLKYYLNVFFIFLISLNTAFGQAPNIKYSGPQNLKTGSPVTPIAPVNTGGAVPANTYGKVSTLAGTPGVTGNANGTGSQAKFYFPTALGVDPSGNIYVNDGGNNIVRKITPAGVVSTFAGSGAYGGTNGTGTTATFSNISGLTVDINGNVYVDEISNEDIRKIAPDGTVSTLAGQLQVAGSANGTGTQATFSNPLGLGTDAAGNIYVADYSNYLIRKITPAGVVTTVAGRVGVAGSANGPDSVATFRPMGCVADKLGNLYITENSNNIIRKISPDGQVTTFAGSGAPGSADGVGTAATFNQPDAIAIDAAGNLYVGDDSNITIRKITPLGVVTTFAGTTGISGSNDGVGTAARFSGPAGLAVDANGNLYVADVMNGTIRKISITGYSIDKSLPAGLIFDPTTGSITGTPTVVSPATDYTITAYNTTGNSTTTINIQVTGDLSFSPIQPKVYGTADLDPAVSTAGPVTYTSSNQNVAAITNGKIHIKSTGASKIAASNGSTTISQTLTVTPAPLTIIADNKSRPAGSANPVLTMTFHGFVNGDTVSNLTTQPLIITTANNLSLPASYPITASGAADSNYTIGYIPGMMTVLGGSFTTPAPSIGYSEAPTLTVGKAMSPFAPVNTGGTIPVAAYGKVTTIAGEKGVAGATNGSGTAATFNQPYGIAVDSAGNIYVAEQVNNLIRKITPAGVVSTFAGSGTAGANNGQGTSASFNFPSGIAIDKSGNLYVAEQGSGLIRKITPQGLVSTFAGGGTSLNGQGTQASFFGPIAITIDQSGNLYVSDTYNDLIRKITPSGLVSTLAGIQRVQGTADGPGSSATFLQPAAITTDAAGNVYVSDRYNLRKILPDGTVSTIAGKNANGSNDGVGTQASFSIPAGLATDRIGNLYVADQGNNLIRKVTPSGVVTTIVGTPGTYGAADSIGRAARINFPSGMTIDITGTLYFDDEGNNQIRKVDLTGYSIDKTLPTGLTFDPKTGIISGTPTKASPSTDYTVTAYNLSGNSTAIISLAVGLPSDASLKSLNVTAGTLSPVFAPQITNYTVNVPNATSSISIAALANDTSASVKVNGTKLTAGATTSPIALNVGTNTIAVLVTAADSTTKTYTVAVTRAASSDASLSSLAISNGTLSPSFVAGTFAYTASVSNAVTSISVTAIADDAQSAIKVNSVSTPSGSVSAGIPLTVGANTITIQVTAADNTTKTYTLTVNRSASSDAGLSNLSISGVTLSPVFSTFTNAYAASVSNSVSSINVIASTSDAAASLSVNGVSSTSGNPSADIPLTVGNNAITVVVTAQDGITKNTYTVNLTREIPEIFTLSPDNFKLTVTSATCKGTSDGSITLTAVANLNYSVTVSGNGLNTIQAFNSSTTINNLGAGTYNVCITVVGQPDYQQCYSIVVTEPQDLSVYSTVNDANKTVTLSLAGGNEYSIDVNGVAYSTSNISITLPLAEGNNNITINTDKLCQGVVQKLINFSGNISPYPVPFQNTLYLNIGNAIASNVSLEMYDVSDGRKVLSKQFGNQSGVLQLDVSNLNYGVYVLHLKMNNSEKIFKITKK